MRLWKGKTMILVLAMGWLVLAIVACCRGDYTLAVTDLIYSSLYFGIDSTILRLEKLEKKNDQLGTDPLSK